MWKIICPEGNIVNTTHEMYQSHDQFSRAQIKLARSTYSNFENHLI